MCCVSSESVIWNDEPLRMGQLVLFAPWTLLFPLRYADFLEVDVSVEML